MVTKRKSTPTQKKPGRGNKGGNGGRTKVVNLTTGLTKARIEELLKDSPKIRMFDRKKGEVLTKEQLRRLLKEACTEDCPIVTLNAPFKLRPLGIVS